MTKFVKTIDSETKNIYSGNISKEKFFIPRSLHKILKRLKSLSPLLILNTNISALKFATDIKNFYSNIMINLKLTEPQKKIFISKYKIKLIGLIKPLDIKNNLNSSFLSFIDKSIYLKSNNPNENFSNLSFIESLLQKNKINSLYPGYGFLSECGELVKLCDDNNVIFIGPSERSMKKVGDKLSANKVCKKIGVPIIPSFSVKKDFINLQDSINLEDSIDSKNVKDSEKFLKNKTFQKISKFIKKHSLPLMFKSSNSGGGKGIRLLNDINKIEETYKLAKEEGEGEVFVTKNIVNARHLEVQVIAFQKKESEKIKNLNSNFRKKNFKKNITILGTRDCSIQRNYQKLIEESPQSILSNKLIKKINKYSAMIANNTNYKGVCTIEYLYDMDNDKIYFLEVNSRIQVEHPVSERVYGVCIGVLQCLISVGISRERSMELFGIIKENKNVTKNGKNKHCKNQSTKRGKLENEKKIIALNKIRYTKSLFNPSPLPVHSLAIRVTSESPLLNPSIGSYMLSIPNFIESNNNSNVYCKVDIYLNGGCEVDGFCDNQIGHIFITAGYKNINENNQNLNRNLAINKMIELISSIKITGIQTPLKLLYSTLSNLKFKENIHTNKFLESEILLDFKKNLEIKEYEMFWGIALILHLENTINSNLLEFEFNGKLWKFNVFRMLDDVLGFEFFGLFYFLNFKILNFNALKIKVGDIIFERRGPNSILCTKILNNFYNSHTNDDAIDNLILKYSLNPNKLTSKFSCKIIKVLIKENQKLKINDILFEVEIMKMRKLIRNEKEGNIKTINVKGNDFVSEGDLLLEYSNTQNITNIDTKKLSEKFKFKGIKKLNAKKSNLVSNLTLNYLNSMFSETFNDIFNFPDKIFDLTDINLTEKLKTFLNLKPSKKLIEILNSNLNFTNNLISFFGNLIESLKIEKLNILSLNIPENNLYSIINRTHLHITKFYNLLIEIKNKSLFAYLGNLYKIIEELKFLLICLNLQNNIRNNTEDNDSKNKNYKRCITSKCYLFCYTMTSDLKYLESYCKQEVLDFENKNCCFKFKNYAKINLNQNDYFKILKSDQKIGKNCECQGNEIEFEKISERPFFKIQCNNNLNIDTFDNFLLLNATVIDFKEFEKYCIIKIIPSNFITNLIISSSSFEFLLNDIMFNIVLFNYNITINNIFGLFFVIQNDASIDIKSIESIENLINQNLLTHKSKMEKLKIKEIKIKHSKIKLIRNTNDLMEEFVFKKDIDAINLKDENNIYSKDLNTKIIEICKSDIFDLKMLKLETAIINHKLVYKNTNLNTKNNYLVEIFRDKKNCKFIFLLKILFFEKFELKLKIDEIFLNKNKNSNPNKQSTKFNDIYDDCIRFEGEEYSININNKNFENIENCGLKCYLITPYYNSSSSLDMGLKPFILQTSDKKVFNGSFGSLELILYTLTTNYCTLNNVYRLFIGSNSGVRIGINEEILKYLKIEKNKNLENDYETQNELKDKYELNEREYLFKIDDKYLIDKEFDFVEVFNILSKKFLSNINNSKYNNSINLNIDCADNIIDESIKEYYFNIKNSKNNSNKNNKIDQNFFTKNMKILNKIISKNISDESLKILIQKNTVTLSSNLSFLSINKNNDFSGPESLKLASLASSSTILNKNTISYITKLCVGIGAYLAKLSENIYMENDSAMLLTGYKALNVLIGDHNYYKSNFDVGGSKIMEEGGVVNRFFAESVGGMSLVVDEIFKNNIIKAKDIDMANKNLNYYNVSQKSLNSINDEISIKINKKILKNSENFKTISELSTNFDLLEQLFDKNSLSQIYNNHSSLIRLYYATLEEKKVLCIYSESSVLNYESSDFLSDILTSKISLNCNSENMERLPIFFIANFKGFDGGDLQMKKGVLNKGSSLLKALNNYDNNLYIYVPNNSELRGGTYVIFDPLLSKNNNIKLVLHPKSKIGVLESDALNDIKVKKNNIMFINNNMFINEYKEVGREYCRLHDYVYRMSGGDVEIKSVNELRESLCDYFL